MRTISLWQPWASLVVHGLKKIETRGYPTNVRGRIAIHATKTEPADTKVVVLGETFCLALETIGGLEPYSLDYGHAIEQFKLLPRGAILGSVELYGCVDSRRAKSQGLSDEELCFGNYSEGRFGWLLRDPILFETPIPAKGKQGFWNYEGPI